MENFIRITDFQLLANQKLTLINLASSDGLPEQQRKDLDGLINFLDGFQDAVVDSGVLPEEKVFQI